MKNAVWMFFACALVAASAAGASTIVGDFYAGTGAELRISTNYIIADTLGQFVVGESTAPDDSYACGIIEHGFWHSDIHIPAMSEIKQTANYQWVDAYAKIVAAGSDQFAKEFYITDGDRVNAIRVNLGSNPLIVSVGDMLDVSGIIKGTNAGRYIDYPVVTPRFPNVAVLQPFFMRNEWLGGRGTDVLAPGGMGVLNTSLLVKTSGRVTYVDTAATKKFFYIDDGSGLSDGTVISGQTMRGIKVSLINLTTGNVILPPAKNDLVAVTGICSPYSASGKVLVQIRPRNQGDIRVIPE